MRKGIKLHVFQEKVEKIFLEAKSFSSSSVPPTEGDLKKLKISIAERLLHLNHHPKS